MLIVSLSEGRGDLERLHDLFHGRTCCQGGLDMAPRAGRVHVRDRMLGRLLGMRPAFLIAAASVLGIALAFLLEFASTGSAAVRERRPRRQRSARSSAPSARWCVGLSQGALPAAFIGVRVGRRNAMLGGFSSARARSIR
jgi:hypothetical protein